MPAASHAGVQDILLIAFALAFNEFRGGAEPTIGIDVEGHGREEKWAGDDVDLSRTVGWFTAKYPVALTPGAISWERQVRGDAPGCGDQGGLGTTAGPARRGDHGLLRYLNADGEEIGAEPGIGFKLPRPNGFRR